MYDGDAPLAERRAQALTLDRDLLRELLGQEELRELLDPAALADLELSLQAWPTTGARRPLDQVHDLLRRLGDLSSDEVAGARRGRRAASPKRGSRSSSRRVGPSRFGSRAQRAGSPSRTSARYRDAVGVQPPSGVPFAFLGPTTAALEGLLARWARTHGPFLPPEPAARWGLPVGVVEDTLERMLAAGTILRGEFRPGGAEREWCDPDVLRQLRRRSLARLRREVEPVEPAALARFLAAWQGVMPLGDDRPALRGTGALERLAEVVDQLSGLALPASVLERDILPARVPGYQPRLLDELGALGEVAWVGRGALGRDDGRIALVRPGRTALLGDVPAAGGGGAAVPAAPVGREPPIARMALATRRSGAGWPGAARASTASCTRRPAAGRTARSSTPCGTLSGPARSRTTPLRRCGRCAGGGPRAIRGAGRAG